jgi:hypothetical protein
MEEESVDEQPAVSSKVRKPSSGNALLALLCTAQLVLTLDFSIVNVALPTIQREPHFSSANLQWLVTGYALTLHPVELPPKFESTTGTLSRNATAGELWPHFQVPR